jgi:adenylate cyclase
MSHCARRSIKVRGECPVAHRRRDYRREELSRTVDGGFLASRVAMERFSSVPPFAIRNLRRLPIRGRADGIDVIGIDGGGGSQESMVAKRKVYDQGAG